SVTNSVVFNRLAPFNLTGVNVGYYGESFGLEGFLVNGWDADANGLNFDEDFSYGGKLGGTVGPLGLQFTYIGGKEDGTNDRHVLDGVATLTFDLSDDVTLFTGGEVNVGWEDDTDPQASNDKTWWGVISTTRLLCGAFGLTFRYDYAHVPDGFPGAPAVEIKNLNLMSYTGAASYDFTDNMIARLEYRYDQSEGPNPYILDDGRRAGDNNTFFAQFIYHW
ncbi:MAG: porin, partial [Candidatus Methylomirabilis sp.]|nr:porin [Deltaproteobacteria bacterium]